jgi:CRP-like cAMP-binding protein
VYLLLAGSVKVTGATDEGDSLLAIRVGGDLVGELAALDGRPRLATVTTAGPLIAQVIAGAEFVGLLSRDPELSLAVTRGVTDKLRTATSRRVEFTGCDVNTRFARVLLELAERYGEQAPQGRTIGCPLTQTELATLAGAAEPTVQRALRQLKADGIVATGYRVTTVLDMAALRQRAYPEPALRGIPGPTGGNGPKPSRDGMSRRPGPHDETRQAIAQCSICPARGNGMAQRRGTYGRAEMQ